MDNTPHKLLLGGVVGGVCLVVTMIIVLSLLLCRDKYRKGHPDSNAGGSVDNDHFTGTGPGWQHANRARGTTGQWEIASPTRGARNSDWQVGPFTDEHRFWRGQHGTWQLAPYSADRCRLPRSSIGDWESSTGPRNSRHGSHGNTASESAVTPPDPYSRVIRPLHDANTPFSQTSDNSSSPRFANRYQSRPLGSTTGSLAIVPFRESRLPNSPVSYAHDGHFTTRVGGNRLPRDTDEHRVVEPRRPSRDDVSSEETRRPRPEDDEPQRERRYEPRQARYIRSAEQQRKHGRDALKRNGISAAMSRRSSTEEQTHAKLTRPEDLQWPSASTGDNNNLTHDSGFHELLDEQSADVKRGARLPRIQNTYLNHPADSFM